MALQASSMLAYAGLDDVVPGKLFAMTQTRRKRLATCIAVVRNGARTMPVEVGYVSLRTATRPYNHRDGGFAPKSLPVPQ